MNRTAFGLMAIAGLMAFSSCSSEMTEEVAQGDNATAVFTLKLPSALGSRAGSYGDEVSASIDKLTYSVFKVVGGEDENSYEYQWIFDETKDYTSIGFGTEILNIPLVKNVTYRIAFCAYSSKCTSGYASFSKGDLKVDYNKCAVNDVEQDMFVSRSVVFDITSGHSETINLTRPFAQLNWGASDAFVPSLDEYRNSMTVQVKIDPGLLCSKLNVLTNKGTKLEDDGFEEETVDLSQFYFKDIPSADEVSFPVENTAKPYTMVAMHYLLVGPDEATGNVKMEFREGLNDVDVSVANAPLYTNFRTNIFGDLLTTPGVFTLSMDQAFGSADDPDAPGEQNPTITVIEK